MPRILVVEDNHDLAVGLQHALDGEGYETTLAPNAEQGLDAAARIEPALVVLDLMLPGMDGYTMLDTLRHERYDGPVLILSARTAEVDKLHGFRLGADDYLTKPFGLMELLARVHALLRRSGRAAPPPTDDRLAPVIRLGAIEIRVGRREVLRGGVPVALRPMEFDLLIAILRRRGEVATRRQLLHDVWGYAEDVTSRTVDAHVAALRRKLEDDAASPTLITTVRSVGYRMPLGA